MLSTYGRVKIISSSQLQEAKGYMAIFLKVESWETSLDGKDRFDRYDAVMYFASRDAATEWLSVLAPEKILEIRWATLQGDMPGKETGKVRIRLYPDIRHTIPK